MGLAGLMRRWRHRKGFGVHSPFAFSLILDVAGAPGHYYGDELLRKHIGPRRGTLRRQAWLLHRLMARLDPLTIVLQPGLPEEFRIAASIARTDRTPVDRVPDGSLDRVMLVCTTDWLAANHGIGLRFLTSPGSILMAIRAVRPFVHLPMVASDAMHGGWGLIDPSVAIFIASDKVPYLTYDVKLV